jgi:hypothetical protein
MTDQACSLLVNFSRHIALKLMVIDPFRWWKAQVHGDHTGNLPEYVLEDTFSLNYKGD